MPSLLQAAKRVKKFVFIKNVSTLPSPKVRVLIWTNSIIYPVLAPFPSGKKLIPGCLIK
jgi:hypothetical protein